MPEPIPDTPGKIARAIVKGRPETKWDSEKENQM